jgi:pimeloyl-ACP methyl ester carboxylesterase
VDRPLTKFVPGRGDLTSTTPWVHRRSPHPQRLRHGDQPGPIGMGSAALGLTAGAAWWWKWRHQHSAAVTAWAPGHGTSLRAGPLHVRILGTGEPVVLLLHGMVGAGNSYGAAYDALAARATVVVPDLLGFGRSMDNDGPTDAPAHIAALDAAMAELGLQHRPTVVAGHSMGGALAVRWAAAQIERVRAVVTFGAPLYRNRGEADAHITGMGRMQALLAGDGPLPRAACAWMCRHRTAASWIAVAYRPDLPVPVARFGVQHTWDTYTGALNGLVRDTGWYDSLTVLTQASVPVPLTAGAADTVPVPGRAEDLASSHPNITSLTVDDAGHDLPFTHPHWCLELIQTFNTRVSQLPGPPTRSTHAEMIKGETE